MIERTLNILKILGKTSSILLLGPRGVGKTYLSKIVLCQYKNALRIDLLRFKTHQRYLKDPELLRNEIDELLSVERHLLVAIDEIQKIPPLLDEVHAAIEDYQGRLQFLLTGSSARKLKKGGANLLAGRALGVMLHPFTSEEIKIDLERVLQFGTLPAIFLNVENPIRFLKTYVETYLKEEILQEALVRKYEAFSRFFEIAGQFHGRHINASEIAKSANVSAQTVQDYFQILIDTFLAFKLHGWDASTHKQLRITPKFYLFDNGVANAIRGELSIELSPRSSRWGHLFESWIIQEAFRINDNHQLDLKFFYWRTNNDQEVDLIISKGLGQPLAAIEIKSDDAPDEKCLKGLKLFRADYPNTPLYVFSTSPRSYSLEGIKILPWQAGLSLLKEL